MTKHLACIWTVEPLGQGRWKNNAYSGNEYYFGLTGSLAIGSNAPTTDVATDKEIELLKPWNWQRSGTGAHQLVVRAMLWNGDPASAPRQLMTATQRPDIHRSFPTLADGAGVWPAAQQRLDKLFDAAVKADPRHARFLWNPDKPFDVERGQPWHILLAHVANAPYPIAQLANLSVIFTVPQSQLAPYLNDNTLRLYAALEFAPPNASALTLVAGDVNPVPAGTLVPVTANMTGVGSPAKWMYGQQVAVPASPTTPASSLDAIAYVGGSKLTSAGDGTSAMRFTSGWIAATPADPGERERRSQLPERTAAFLDLAQWTIAGARRLLDTDRAAAVAALGDIRDMTLAALRDQAGDGTRPGPRGQSLLQYLWQLWLESDPSIDAASLEKEVATALSAAPQPMTLLQWNGILNDALPSELRVTPQQMAQETPKDALDQLESIRAAVLSAPVASALFIRQLGDRVAPGISPANAPLWGTFIVFAKQKLKELQAGRWLSLASLGVSHFVDEPLAIPSNQQTDGAWNSVLAALDEERTLPNGQALPSSQRRDELVAVLNKAFTDRFTQTVPPQSFAARAYPRVSPAAGVIALVAPASTAAVAAAMRIVPDPAPTDEPTGAPHPVVLRVGERTPLDLTAGSPGGPPDDDDPLRRMSGVGLLVGVGAQSNPPEWYCLNMAELETTTTPLLVPYRLSYAHGERQGVVSYDNHPLVGRDAAARLSDHELTPPPMANGKPSVEDSDLFCYESLDPSPAPGASCPLPWHRIPGLAFGRDYQFRSFIVTNSGALPPALVDDNAYPAAMRSSATFAVGGGSIPAPAVVRYRRRVRVGQPRLRISAIESWADDTRTIIRNETPADRSRGGMPFPEIPTDVSPRAREITSGATTEATPPLLLLGVEGALVPKACTFTVRPPSTDIETWDRWVAANEPYQPCTATTGSLDSAARVLRRGVRRDYFTRVLQNHRDPARKTDPFDVSLDDPAVSGVRLEVQTYDGTKWVNLAPALRYDVQFPPLAGSDISATQFVGQPVRVQAASIGKSPRIIAATPTNPVTIELPPGSPYRVSARCMLRDIGRFAAIAGGATTPYQMDVEIATPEFISPTELRKTIAASFVDDQLTITLPTAQIDKAQRIHRVTLMRQVWQWRGRPTPALTGALTAAGTVLDPDKVYTAAGPKELTLRQWEAREFGERDDDNHAAEEMRTEWPVANTPNDRTFVYRENLKQDQRSLFVRFAMRAYSRYAAVFPADASDTLIIDSREAGWASTLIPCRPAQQPRAPLVRAVLPLTERVGSRASASDPSSQPGVLVILGEGWYELGGLSEEFAAELGEPVKDFDTGTMYPPAGPDPIVSGSARTDPLDAALSTTGPVGHTFDRAGLPRFVATSFLIDVPKPPAGGQAIPRYPWLFAKLRFARRLRTTSGVVSSPWSPEYWVQYLPAFSLSEDTGHTNAVDVGELQLASGAAPSTIQLQRRTTNTSWAPGAESNRFTTMLLVTNRIVDITGRPDQEAFVGMFVNQGGSWTGLKRGNTVPTLPADASSILARIVEIQLGSGAATSFAPADENELWTALFGNPDSPPPSDPVELPDKALVPLPSKHWSEERSRARIVRMSAPIPFAGH